MQYIGVMGTQILNLVVICNEIFATEIVQNLLQFYVIAQIDEFLAFTLKNNLAYGILEGQVTLSFAKLGRDGRDPLTVNNQKCFKYPFIWTYKLIQAFYDSIYFYFMPYLAIVISFFSL